MKKIKKGYSEIPELPLRSVIKKLIAQAPRARHYRALIDVLDHIDGRGIGGNAGDPLISGSTLLQVISAEIPEVADLVRQHHKARKHNQGQFRKYKLKKRKKHAKAK